MMINLKRHWWAPRTQYIVLNREPTIIGNGYMGETLNLEVRIIHLWRHPIKWWKLRPRRFKVKLKGKPVNTIGIGDSIKFADAEEYKK